MIFRNSLGAVVAALVATAACAHASRPSQPAATPLRPAPPIIALRNAIDTVLDNPQLAHGSWAVFVKSLNNDERVYERNADKLMMPASTMKIVTLAAAAEKLGWDYRFVTTITAAGPVEGGSLRGDLVVTGSGDPSLVAADGMADRVFADWAAQLKQRGIRVISGRIIGDDNGFEEETLGFGWMWDDLPTGDSAGSGALQYNESAVRVTVSSGPSAGDSAAISVGVGNSGLAIVNAVTTNARGATTSIEVRRLPGSMNLELRGSIALGAAPSTLSVSVDNPTQFFVNALRTALIANGIDVRGPAVDIDEAGDVSPARGTPLVSYQSAPLSTLAIRLMKVSQNQYAETLLKAVGGGPGALPATTAGWRAAQAIVEGWGVRPGALIQRDGSGLTRYDFVTPESLVTILTHVDRDPRLKDPFEASLPIAGRDGTLTNRMKGTAAEGNARAKTGSMTAVRGTAGYVTSADGERFVFAILVNSYDSPAAAITAAEDAIIVRLAQLQR